ncbi:MFS transporter, partial [Mycolicibacterium elephantis]
MPGVRSRPSSSGVDGARTRHPAVIVAVLAAAGISVSLMQTLVIPLIPELPALLHTNA